MTEFPSARQERILHWLQDQPTISIEELIDRLGVSGMTVHRDLNDLARTGAVEKVRGGVRLIGQTFTGLPVSVCAVCGGSTHDRTAFLVTRPDGAPQAACCPHCGLLMHGIDSASSVLARDYLYGRMVNARQASYVIDSTVILCCQPSVLCFATAADAEKFQHGFGGQRMGFEDARAAIATLHRTCGGHGQHP